ncbi:MAG TPA: carboxypeptidase regulatory-like domain-containing protein [Kofleriaceae bacterium]|nr:carboxypeptidase regulatory-like domain-containing protein [Kofleriaceae bacterium]
MRWLLPVLVLVLVAAPGVHAPATAAPVISIRARTDAQLRTVRRREDGLIAVRGAIVDRASTQGIGGLDVAVTVSGARHDVITSTDGGFDVLASPSPGAVDVEITFAGDDRFDPATLVERGIDPSRAPVDMTIDVSTTPLGALITVETHADGARVEQLPISLRFSAADASEPHVDVDAKSGTRTMVKRADILGPGAKRVRAKFTGDTAYGAAAAEATFDLATSTHVDLSLGGDTVAFEGTIHARGKVTDDDGKPVARVVVALIANVASSGERRIGAATTGPDGAYRIDASADLLGTGKHSLQARVETTERWRKPSSSMPPARITVGTRRPAPVGITVAAFAATALVAIGFVIGRRRPWRKAEPPPPPSAAQAEVRGGLEPARASIVSTLRRAHDHGFAGVVRDAVRQRPIAAAEILLTFGAEVRRSESEDDGRFAIEELPPGEWNVRVASPGHVSEQFTLTIPHRGELRGARIDLVPVREKIFTLYRRAALPVLPSPDLWGIWSPRQIVDHVRARTPPVRMAELTEFVEEAYFSARTPDEGLLPLAESKVAAALAERAGPAL